MKLRLGGILLLAGLSSAFGAAPLPLPNTSYLGIAKTISMGSNYNGAGTNGGGGAFYGQISGFDTTMWCVDDQLYFAFTQSGLANVIGLNQITSNDSRVRYGDVHNAAYDSSNTQKEWTNQTGLLASIDSAQERYRMAAYLISQYDFVTTGNPQSGLKGGASAAKNNAIQNTIWAITNNNSTTAQNAGNTAPDATWLQLAKDNYKNVDMTKWAVVSWTVDVNGKLGTDYYSSSTAARQTFLVQVVPEPGFYGMLSLGLGGLFVAVAKRRKNKQKES